jgi:hypothetical protein
MHMHMHAHENTKIMNIFDYESHLFTKKMVYFPMLRDK